MEQTNADTLHGHSPVSGLNTSLTDRTSNNSSVATGSTCTALLQGSHAATPQDAERSEAKAQHDSVTVGFLDLDGRPFDTDGDAGIAAVRWRGDSMSNDMWRLMLLSALQLGVGYTLSFWLVGIPLVVTAVMGLFVSLSYIKGPAQPPGMRQERQVKLVRDVSYVAVGISVLSMAYHAFDVGQLISLLGTKASSIELVFISGPYLAHVAHTLLFFRVARGARAVLLLTHPSA